MTARSLPGSDCTALPDRLSADHALILDFDGTLVDLQDDPNAVHLGAGVDAVLEHIALQLGGAVAVLSGRDIRDLALRLPPQIWRLGGHGMSVCAPGDAPPDVVEPGPAALHGALDAIAARIAGVRCEHKGAVIAVHTRANPTVAAQVVADVRAVVSRFEDYRVQQGKDVVEAKPATADKGRAIDALMQHPPFAGRIPIMLGDDATDEDGFRVVQQLGGIGVKVGEGETVAVARLATPAAVDAWLRGACCRSDD